MLFSYMHAILAVKYLPIFLCLLLSSLRREKDKSLKILLPLCLWGSFSPIILMSSS